MNGTTLIVIGLIAGTAIAVLGTCGCTGKAPVSLYPAREPMVKPIEAPPVIVKEPPRNTGVVPPAKTLADAKAALGV